VTVAIFKDNLRYLLQFYFFMRPDREGVVYMKKASISIFLIFLLLCLVLSSCSSDYDSNNTSKEYMFTMHVHYYRPDDGNRLWSYHTYFVAETYSEAKEKAEAEFRSNHPNWTLYRIDFVKREDW